MVLWSTRSQIGRRALFSGIHKSRERHQEPPESLCDFCDFKRCTGDQVVLSVIPAFGRLRQENHMFKATLGYLARSCVRKKYTGLVM
jgi:hypothetical protein